MLPDSPHELLNAISPPLDALLATQLISEYVSLEQRFVLRDWEPAELDGGQFCEILARILYHMDSANLNVSKGVNECLSYIENGESTHHHTPRSDFLHLAKVIRTAYKFRSARGAVHISATYAPNQMDATFVLECAKWCFAESLRLFWNRDRGEVAKTIRNILQFDAPCIGVYGSRRIVQRVGLTAEQELLIHLHGAGTEGISRNALGKFMFSAASTISNALAKLVAADCRQVIQNESGNYQLTDLGSKRVREDLSDFLSVE